MNSKWITSFLYVVQNGSVNAAAQKMFISSQALLQQINFLEREVGVKLFLRTKAGMELTPAGKEFLRFAQDVETLYARTLSRCRLVSEAEKTVRIPMMSDIILPEFMERICSRFNERNTLGLKTEFIPDSRLESWMEGLINLRYDIIEHFSIDGLCPPSVHFEFLSSVPTWCMMSRYHELAERGTLVPEDFEGKLLLSPASYMEASGYLRLYLRNAGIHVRVEEIENGRYPIIAGLNRGGIYLTNEDIAKVFIGFRSVPLDFDNHVQHGLACRKEMFEIYRPFFEIAREVASELRASDNDIEK